MEAIVDESPDALIALSPDGRIQLWSSGAEGIFGWSREESIGRLLEELIVPADRLDEARGALARALEGTLDVVETVRRRKCGATVEVEGSMRAARDEHGGVRFIVVHEKDVSSLRRS